MITPLTAAEGSPEPDAFIAEVEVNSEMGVVVRIAP